MNGTPLLLVKLKRNPSIIIRFYYDNIEVIPNEVYVYYINLNDELYDSIMKIETIVCKLEINKFYKIENKLGRNIENCFEYDFEHKKFI
jgi:hypothetical protein